MDRHRQSLPVIVMRLTQIFSLAGHPDWPDDEAGAGGEDGEVETGVGVEGPTSSSIANLTLVLPPLVEMVWLAMPPVSST